MPLEEHQDQAAGLTQQPKQGHPAIAGRWRVSLKRDTEEAPDALAVL
jgi:hypothetical protein